MHYLTVFEENVWSEYELNVAAGMTPIFFTLSKNSVEDYVEENKQLLIDWLIHANRFPYTVYLAAYEEMYNDPEDFLIKEKMPYEKRVIASEKKPVYIFEMKDAAVLTKSLSEFYWLPAQNEMMLITDSGATVELTEQKISPKSSYTTLEMVLYLTKEEGIAIEFRHDGQGMGITSTTKTFGTVKAICGSFPKGYTVQQWDGDVLIPYEM